MNIRKRISRNDPANKHLFVSEYVFTDNLALDFW